MKHQLRKSIAVFFFLFFLVNVLADISDLTIYNTTTGKPIKGILYCTKSDKNISIKIFESNNQNLRYNGNTSCSYDENELSIETNLSAGQYRIEAKSSDPNCSICIIKRYFNVSQAYGGSNVYEMPLLFVIIILTAILYLIRKRKKNQKREERKKEVYNKT